MNAESGALPHQSHLKRELELLTRSVPGIMQAWHQEHSQVRESKSKIQDFTVKSDKNL